MSKRLENLAEEMHKGRLDVFMVTRLPNVRYLTGFTGSNAVVVVGRGAPVLLTDGRYREQVAREAPSCEPVIYRGEVAAALAGVLPDSGTVGFEESVSFAFHSRMAAAVPAGVVLKPTESLVEGLRAVKDAGEVSAIRGAVRCAAAGFEGALPVLRAGATEHEVASEIDYRMALAGAERPAFDTIVASGPDSSMPHATAGSRALAGNDLVMVDFGALNEGYRSDITRMVSLGGLSGHRTEVFDAVLDALSAAIDVLEPGIRASAVDAEARRVLEERGLAERFEHGLGHGVGLEAHEKPSLSLLSRDVLEPGMVFTLEPGVYFEGEFGVRVEEMVLLTGEGPEVITRGIAIEQQV
ncbi:MAG: Xaa-Pro peptidase family protein [Actinobacteria bacterium]|nr:Xaa-Pro peptidase family protein [Actinomycetota bacterium]MBU1942237.1 Xaa-Pro peptidase family protein [Actinomycetota bacterium]MBU2687414.1 Xaa-Pro peptidase family protein [Actinomycetota bacterium]